MKFALKIGVLLWCSAMSLWVLTQEGFGVVIYICGALFFPALCILFPGALGSFIGPTARGAITSESPDFLIELLGWFLTFLIPVLFLTLI